MYEISTPVVAAIVVGQGTTSTDRKLDVLRRTQSSAVVQMAMTMKGKIGAAARESGRQHGMVGIVEAAFRSNFRPLAEYLALETGEAVVISSRASFEALPDLFEAKVHNAKAGKNGGYRTNADGLDVPGAKLALALRLRDFVVGVTTAVAEMHAEAKARREAEARDAEIKALLDAADTETTAVADPSVIDA